LCLLCAPLPTVRQVCVTAIPQKTQRKSQKTQSDALACILWTLSVVEVSK